MKQAARPFRALVMAAALLATVFVAPAAHAGVAAHQVEVRLIGGEVDTYTDCDGVRSTIADAVLLFINRVGTDTSGDVHVDLTYSGTLVAGVDFTPAPASVTIPAGERSTPLALNRLTNTTGTLTIEATGPGITPATGRITTGEASSACVTYPAVTRQVVVGQPLLLGLNALFPDVPGSALDGTIRLRSGQVPPGLSAGSTISGTPATVGRYSFVLEACKLRTCGARLPITLDVVAAAVPSPSNPPAVNPPVSGSSAANPGAAAPVAAVPTYTG